MQFEAFSLNNISGENAYAYYMAFLKRISWRRSRACLSSIRVNLHEVKLKKTCLLFNHRKCLHVHLHFKFSLQPIWRGWDFSVHLPATERRQSSALTVRWTCRHDLGTFTPTWSLYEIDTGRIIKSWTLFVIFCFRTRRVSLAWKFFLLGSRSKFFWARFIKFPDFFFFSRFFLKIFYFCSSAFYPAYFP